MNQVFHPWNALVMFHPWNALVMFHPWNKTTLTICTTIPPLWITQAGKGKSSPRKRGR